MATENKPDEKPYELTADQFTINENGELVIKDEALLDAIKSQVESGGNEAGMEAKPGIGGVNVSVPIVFK